MVQSRSGQTAHHLQFDAAGLPNGRSGRGERLRVKFEFLADSQQNMAPVLTGHADGVITLNIAEADDVERERRRHELGEPYRTLLGHFRHEVGHYYWNLYINGTDRLTDFRELFGDEQADYTQALAQHYQNGPAADWQSKHVSSYASAHPWEDWAETWAHYMHITDTLETAVACGLSLRPKRQDEPTLLVPPSKGNEFFKSFDLLIESWFPLTYVLNNLNRGLGLQDSYPFVLPPPVIEKLRFIHAAIRSR